MHEETADKFLMGKGDLPFRISRPFPSGRKGDCCIGNRKDPGIGYGHPVGITPQVLDGIAKAVKCLLDIGTLFFFIKCIFEFLPAVFLPQCLAGGRKNKFLLLVKCIQKGKVFSLELLP